MVEGPAKRQRVDENSEPNRQSVTDEQKAIVEKNRQVALARRSAQTEQRIRQNREAALERRRQRLDGDFVGWKWLVAAQWGPGRKPFDLQHPTSKEDEDRQEHALLNISQKQAEVNQSGEEQAGE
eukprot:g9542.t1